MRFTVILPIALAAVVTANGANQFGQYTNNPELSSLMEKYSTVSGFSKFQGGIVSAALSYAQTMSIPSITGTDPAAIATEPAMTKMESEILSMVTKYIYTQTYLAPNVKSSLEADLKSAQAAVTHAPTTTKGGAAASGTGVETQSTGGAARVAGMGAALAAGVAAIAIL